MHSFTWDNRGQVDRGPDDRGQWGHVVRGHEDKDQWRHEDRGHMDRGHEDRDVDMGQWGT